MTRTPKSHKKGIYSIPELRRSFEHMEQFVNQRIRSRESKEKLCKDLQKEWKAVFMKTLDKKSAMAFVEDRMNHSTRRRTVRKRGGALPIGGAPIDYATRAGLQLAPGSIPDGAGHLPLSNGGSSAFGSYVKYVDGGFFNPEIASTVPGFAQWPSPGKDMGSNVIMKGGNRKSRKIRRHRGGDLSSDFRNAGALLSQAFSRPIPSGAPPSAIQDMQDMWHGKAVGVSPDQIQRQPTYQIGSLFPKPVHL
uniref:Uncharacterized protein n=1 Tax=viral metagenome TaxID=1070528 RepID=A0A6C0KR15_9ZZZZ